MNKFKDMKPLLEAANNEAKGTTLAIDIDGFMLHAHLSEIFNNGLTEVYYINEKAVGLIVADVATHPMYGGKWAMVHLIYVLPESRMSKAGASLLDKFDKWAEKNGATKKLVADNSLISPKLTGKFYKNMGYGPHETIYLK